MKYKVTLNNKVYEVEVEHGDAILLDEYEATIPAPAAPVAAAPAAAPAAPAAAPAPAAPAPAAPVAAGEPIAAPLPGVVTSIKVKAGDAVTAGQLIAIIEAMKMENEILAPRDGSVVQVVAAGGASVSAGDPLVILA